MRKTWMCVELENQLNGAANWNRSFWKLEFPHFSLERSFKKLWEDWVGFTINPSHNSKLISFSEEFRGLPVTLGNDSAGLMNFPEDQNKHWKPAIMFPVPAIAPWLQPCVCLPFAHWPGCSPHLALTWLLIIAYFKNALLPISLSTNSRIPLPPIIFEFENTVALTFCLNLKICIITYSLVILYLYRMFLLHSNSF